MAILFKKIKELINNNRHISSLHFEAMNKLKDCKSKDDIIQFCNNYPQKASKNKIIRFYEENKYDINKYLYQEIQNNSAKSVRDLVAHEDYRAMFDDTDVLFLSDDNRYFLGKWGLIYVYSHLVLEILEMELKDNKG